MDGIGKIIENIPLLFEYFVPGFCAIYFYEWQKGGTRNSTSETIHIANCVIISYVLLIVPNMIRGCMPGLIPSLNNTYLRCAIATVLGLILAWVCYKVRQNNRFRQFIGRVFKVSLAESVMQSCDFDKGPYVSVYGDGVKVSGRVVVYDTNPEDGWIALDYYKVYSCENNKVIDVWHAHRACKRYLIPLNTIKCIVVHYSKDDKDYSTIEFFQLAKMKKDVPFEGVDDSCEGIES